jgi:hypothetical protein
MHTTSRFTKLSLFALLLLAPASRAENLLQSAPVRVHEDVSLRRWKISLIPFAASQGFDIASSYGMRELNPALAGPNGQFGAQSAAIKVGATGAFIGIQYLIVRKHPGAAKFFTKINWAGAALTSSFAVHNYMVR